MALDQRGSSVQTLLQQSSQLFLSPRVELLAVAAGDAPTNTQLWSVHVLYDIEQTTCSFNPCITILTLCYESNTPNKQTKHYTVAYLLPYTQLHV